jgi:hypothetical protein
MRPAVEPIYFAGCRHVGRTRAPLRKALLREWAWRDSSARPLAPEPPEAGDGQRPVRVGS